MPSTNEARIEVLEGLQKSGAEHTKSVDDCIRTINRELGEIVGELRIIKVIMCATAVAAFGQLVIKLFSF